MSLTESDIAQVRDVVVSAIEALVLPRFDEHDRRFDEHDRRFDEQEQRFNQQDERFEALDSRLARLEADIKAVQIDVRELKYTLGKLEGRFEAMEADIKELYGMVTALQKRPANNKLEKLSFEQKLLQVYEDFQLLAKEAGVTLPH